VNLLLYFTMTEMVVNLPPSDFPIPEGYIFFDMDSRSGKEVAHVAQRALEEFGQGIIIIDVREPGDISPLFPVLKKALKYGEQFRYISIGDHDQLSPFINRASYWQSVSKISDAYKIIETIS
jgi:hypothetical protein